MTKGNPLATNVNERDQAGRTPLHYAVIDVPHDREYLAARRDPTRKDEVRQWEINYRLNNSRNLIDSGADVNAVDDEGMAPLHAAAAADSAEVVRLLLDAGAQVDPQNTRGETPLRCAVQAAWSVPESLQLLLDAGANPSIPSQNGRSALDFVRDYGKPEQKAIFGVD